MSFQITNFVRFLCIATLGAVLLSAAPTAQAQIVVATGSGGTGSDYYGGGTMCGVSGVTGIDYGPCGPDECCAPFKDHIGVVIGGVCEPCTGSSSSSSSSDSSSSVSSSSSMSSSSSESSSSASSSDSSSSESSSVSSSSSSSSSASSSSSESSSSSTSSSSVSSSSSSSSSVASSSSSSMSSSGSSESSSSSNNSSSNSSSDASSSASSSSNQSSANSSSSESSGSQSSSSSLPPDCEAQVITSQKDALEIGPELLKNKALRTMKQLVKFSTSRAIKEQLSQDSKRSAKKMQKYILEAMVSLEQLPDIQVVCSSEQYCVLVDNSGPIKQHIQALSKLRNQIIRTLNRGTRLAYPTFEQAQVATKKYGREVKRYTKGLITKANALPQVRFQCS